MDIKSFARGRRTGEREGAEPQIEELVKKYEGRSEGELMEELLKNVDSGRKDGSFSPEKLAGFMNSVSPMLNAEQKKRLSEIAERLK